MPLFFYAARDSNGELVKGTIDALSAQAARVALQDLDLMAEELHEATLQERKAADAGTLEDTSSATTPNLVLEADAPAEPEPTAAQKQDAELKQEQQKARKKRSQKKAYYPFIDTLRLYAGWLLAWYLLVYAIGSYQMTRSLPIRIPYVEALLPPYSSIVLSFTLASFLFLLASTIHTSLGGGRIKGLTLSTLSVMAFVLYRLNVV